MSTKKVLDSKIPTANSITHLQSFMLSECLLAVRVFVIVLIFYILQSVFAYLGNVDAYVKPWLQVK